ncbi:MAG: hypothetical protein RMN52_01680 [Anaerolineae bacterium]|nr:hypothetical protein [Candidatus Roseilinea sp.]MDW8448689.1 hypothetical protein [Anaerolineae bacterium]
MAWLATVALGLIAFYALRQMAFGLFALLGADMRTAQVAVMWLTLALALAWLAFVVFSGEYHRKHVGAPHAVKLFGVTLAIELAIIALYLAL